MVCNHNMKQLKNVVLHYKSETEVDGQHQFNVDCGATVSVLICIIKLMCRLSIVANHKAN